MDYISRSLTSATQSISDRLAGSVDVASWMAPWIEMVTDVVWVVVVVLAFVKMPRWAAIVAGSALVAGGSGTIRVFFSTVLWAAQMCAAFPVTFLVSLWTFSILQTRLVQSLGVALGLDVNHDGHVDILDMLHMIVRKVNEALEARGWTGLAASGKGSTAGSSGAAAARRIEQIDERLRAMEAKLDQLLETKKQS